MEKLLQNPIVYGMETIASNKLNFNERTFIYIFVSKKSEKPCKKDMYVTVLSHMKRPNSSNNNTTPKKNL